jgi:hypothetical protein
VVSKNTTPVSTTTSQTPMADKLDKIHEALATPTPVQSVPVVSITTPPVPVPVQETAPAAIETPAEVPAAPASVAAPEVTVA